LAHRTESPANLGHVAWAVNGSSLLW
jgi:hypothetical protein